jgi:MFS family permease
VVSIFYLGWLVAEYPANAILQNFPVGKTVGITVFGWGAVVMCLGAAQNAAGLLVLRFLLGVLEASSYPAFTIINTMWYKKAEQPLRMALALAGFASVMFPFPSILGCR